MLLLKNLTAQLLCLFTFIPSVFADQYPFNYQIDIQHYAFALTLSDDTDEIIGTASIEILFKSNDVGQFRLDLANKTQERLGKGMKVSSVTSEGTPLKYRHQGDALVIKMHQPVGKEILKTFIIEYRGIPEAGLEIKNNHFGDRTFFCESCLIIPDIGSLPLTIPMKRQRLSLKSLRPPNTKWYQMAF